MFYLSVDLIKTDKQQSNLSLFEGIKMLKFSSLVNHGGWHLLRQYSRVNVKFLIWTLGSILPSLGHFYFCKVGMLSFFVKETFEANVIQVLQAVSWHNVYECSWGVL